MRTSITLLSTALLAAFAAASPLSKRSYDWSFTIYSDGGCPKSNGDPVTSEVGNGAQTACMHLAFDGHSAVFDTSGGYQLNLYQDDSCMGQAEVLDSSADDMCYGAAVFVKGPSSWSSFQVTGS